MEQSTIIIKADSKTSICRICLIYDPDESLSLFEEYNNMYIYEKINYVASIEVRNDDDLPKVICSSCVVALESSYDFKQKCESSDTILRSTISSGRLSEQVTEISIKEENCDEFEYDYLDENVLSLDLPETAEAKLECSDEEIQPTETTFKSRAIDLKLECHDCGGFFKSKSKMRVHWKKEHLPKQLTCPECNRTVKSYKAFHRHMKKRTKSCLNASHMRIEGEGRSRIFHCKLCDAKSKRMQTILTHMVVHTGERPYSCDMCSKTFTQHSSLIGHKEGAHKIYSKEGTCHQCGKHFKGRQNLYKHMQTHSGHNFPCKVCCKVLKSRTILRQHMKRHSGVKSFTCEECAKTFYTSSDLCNHKNKIHKRKVIACDRCNYKTCHHGSMARHRRRHTEQNVACDVCGTFLDNLLQLEMHKKRHFEKNYQCLFCNKMFYARKNLSAHVRKIHNIYAPSKGRNTTVDNAKADVKKGQSPSNS